MGMFDKIKKVTDATQLIQQAGDIVGNLRNSFQSGNDSSEKENSIESENTLEGDSSQVVRIESLEQMEVYLASLQQGASTSVSAALAAQLQVINYVSSPQLIDSTFDLFFQNLRKSLDYAENDQMKDIIREKSTLMIHNYIFFLNAKLTYAIQENKKEGQRLLETAGAQLSNTALACAQLATTDKVSGAMAVLEISIDLFQTGKSEGNVFVKAISWWGKEKENKRKQSDFYKSLSSLIRKLHKYKDLIGKTNLISGLIENYAKDLAEHEVPESIREIVAKLEKLQREKELKKKQFIRLMWAIPVLGCILLAVLSGGQDKWVETHFIWVLIVMFIPASIYFVWHWKTSKKITELETAQNQTHNHLLNKYHAIAKDFEE